MLLPTPRVTVSIVTFNSARVIAACLASLPFDVAVVVADNGSTDDTLDVVAHTRPAAHIIRLRRNLGFGRAHNAVFRHVAKQGDSAFVLVLNPDTILRDGCLDALLQAAQNYPDAGLIGAQHEQENGRVNSCFRNDLDYAPHLARDRTAYRAKAAGAATPVGDICVEQVTGALMLLPCTVLQKVKGFQRKFFMYFEDDDLCARIRRTGYSIILCPAARVVHLEGRSTQETETPQDVRRSFRVDCIKGYQFERSRKIAHVLYHGRDAAFYTLIVTGLWRCLRRATRYRLNNDIGRTIFYLAGLAGLLSPVMGVTPYRD